MLTRYQLLYGSSFYIYYVNIMIYLYIEGYSKFVTLLILLLFGL